MGEARVDRRCGGKSRGGRENSCDACETGGAGVGALVGMGAGEPAVRRESVASDGLRVEAHGSGDGHEARGEERRTHQRTLSQSFEHIGLTSRGRRLYSSPDPRLRA